MMLISTRRPSRDRDGHAIRLRDIAMQVMHAHQTMSYAGDFIFIIKGALQVFEEVQPHL